MTSNPTRRVFLSAATAAAASGARAAAARLGEKPALLGGKAHP